VSGIWGGDRCDKKKKDGQSIDNVYSGGAKGNFHSTF
jgi:hypothetical protein